LIATADGFAYSLVEVIKYALGMNDGIDAIALSHHNAPIQPVVNAIPRAN